MKNQYIINKKRMLSFGRYVNVRGAALALIIFWSILIALALAYLTVAIITKGDWLHIYLSALLLLLSIYKLFVERYVVLLRRYHLFSRMHGASEWTRTITLDEQGVTIEEGQRTERYPYSALKDYRETDDVIHLCFSHRAGLLLYRDAFIEGSWEECRAHLEAHGITKKK